MKKRWTAFLIGVFAAASLCVLAVGAACSHNWVEQVGRLPATCTAKGSVPYTCSKCGDKKLEDLEMLPHDYVETARKAPTCHAAGSVSYQCSVCRDVKTETLAQLEHKWVKISETAAKCAADGSINYKCSLCGETRQELIGALGHDFSIRISSSATCTKSGQVTMKCARCDELTLRSESSLGHDYQKTSTTATCTLRGKATYTCTRCAETKTQSEAKLGHDLPDEASSKWRVYEKATCEKEGSKRARCDRCNEYIYIEIEKLDHQYGDLYLTKLPTKTVSGRAERKCENCGKSKSVTISRGTTDLTDYVLPPVRVSVESDTLLRGSEISFSCDLSEVDIYYALGGKSPTSKEYRILYDPDEPLVITDSTTIRVYAKYSGTGYALLPSEIETYRYVVKESDPWVYLGEDASLGGYMKLESGKKFRPDDKATRYEVVEALDALFGSYATPSKAYFADVDASHRSAVQKLIGAKLLDGYEDGTFRGKNNIKRAELCKVVSLALGLDTATPAAGRFGDVTAAHWAYQYIGALTEAGYLNGDPDGRFRPEDNITRAELVALMNRIAQIEESDGVTIADTAKKHWAYGMICAAVRKADA